MCQESQQRRRKPIAAMKVKEETSGTEAAPEDTAAATNGTPKEDKKPPSRKKDALGQNCPICGKWLEGEGPQVLAEHQRHSIRCQEAQGAGPARAYCPMLGCWRRITKNDFSLRQHLHDCHRMAWESQLPEWQTVKQKQDAEAVEAERDLNDKKMELSNCAASAGNARSTRYNQATHSSRRSKHQTEAAIEPNRISLREKEQAHDHGRQRHRGRSKPRLRSISRHRRHRSRSNPPKHSRKDDSHRSQVEGKRIATTGLPTPATARSHHRDSGNKLASQGL